MLALGQAAKARQGKAMQARPGKAGPRLVVPGRDFRRLETSVNHSENPKTVQGLKLGERVVSASASEEKVFQLPFFDMQTLCVAEGMVFLVFLGLNTKVL